MVLVGYWPLNETSGSTISDYGSGTAANGTCTSCPTPGAISPISTGMSFNGNTPHYYTIPYNSKLENANAITYSGWINFTGSGGATAGEHCPIIWHQDTTIASPNWGNLTRLITTYSTGKPSFTIIQASDNSPITVNGNTSIMDGKWHLVTATFDSSSGYSKIYVDGVYHAQTSFSGTIKTGSTNNFYIGAELPQYQIYCNGSLSNVAIWNRALTPTEITQLYRRGANRVKFQTRYCANNDCSDQTGSGSGWKGPNGTYLSYFSELNNSSGSGPTISLGSGSGSGRYFQYRTILESDDTAGSPTSPLVSLVQPGPTHYFNGGGAVIANSSTQAIPFASLSAFSVTLGAGGCTSGIGYQLSYDNSTWLYWNGSSWTNASGTSQTNTEAEVNTNIARFTSSAAAGTNSNLYIRPILNSNGLTPCEIDNISVTGNKY